MKRYERLSITNLGSHAEILWNEIAKVCQLRDAEYHYEPIEDRTGFGPVARITVNKQKLVSSIIVLAAIKNGNEWEKIYVANIIPKKQSADRLTIDEYNVILSSFKTDIIEKAISEVSNIKLEYFSSEYTMKDIIPESYSRFYSWIKGYPLSYHPNDMERWYEFVSALHINREELGLEDFENCLTQDHHWSVDDAEDFSNRLSDELDLLRVYDSMH